MTTAPNASRLRLLGRGALVTIALATAACSTTSPTSTAPSSSSSPVSSSPRGSNADPPPTAPTTPPGSTAADPATTSPSSAPTGPTTTVLGGNSTGEGEGNAIRKVDFANFTFPSDACGEVFTQPPAHGYEFRDGSVGHGTPGDADFYSVSLNPDIVYGDLTGDGNQEAALILNCVTGTRSLPYGWVYTLTDAPTPLSKVSLSSSERTAAGDGDWHLLIEMSIGAQKLESRWRIFLPGDPLCCASLLATFAQRWNGSAFAPDGTPTISPAD